LGQFEENFDVKSRITHLNLIPIRLNQFLNELRELNEDGELDEQILFFNLAMEQDQGLSSEASNEDSQNNQPQK